MRKLLPVLLLALLVLCATVAHAQEQADDITAGITFSGSGYKSFEFLTDGDMTGIWSGLNPVITIESPEPIGSIYMMLDYNYGTYVVTDPDTGVFQEVRQTYLHQYIDIAALMDCTPNRLELSFVSGYLGLCEMEVYSPGQVPDHVQRWQQPWEGETDILLFCTHGDDDHLYFAGLLPLYAGEKKLNVQVVYMTDHRNDTYLRTHEMLNGLWAVGVRAYPVFGWFADFICYDMELAYETYYTDYDTTWAMLQEFVVEQLRRFKPQVAVGHDIYGEYGHAMHKIYTDLLISARSMIKDPSVFPDSAERWGTWELPKLYLHLYWGNTLVMDYDQPLKAFDGMTAFEVSQKLGFPCHQSQQWDKFVNWLYGENGEITRCDQIQLYNPANFGLYYTKVGKDEQKNDLMEHITPHAYVRRKAAAEEAFRTMEPQRSPEVEGTPAYDFSAPLPEPEIETPPPVTQSTGPSHSLWIDLAVNGLILALGIALLVVGIRRLKKRK